MQKIFYFPLIPRLLAIYKSPELAKLMNHHSRKRSSDSKMRGPYESLA
jgi:hypothetical protein